MLRFAKRTITIGIFQGTLVYGSVSASNTQPGAGGYFSTATAGCDSSLPRRNVQGGDSTVIPPSSATYPANNPTEDRIVTASFDVKRSGGVVSRWDVGAVFDGHGGWQVAQMASQRLVPEIMRQLALEDKDTNGTTDAGGKESITSLASDTSAGAAMKPAPPAPAKAGWGYLFGGNKASSGTRPIENGTTGSDNNSDGAAVTPSAGKADEDEVMRVVRAFHATDQYYVDSVARPAFAAGFGEVASVGSCVCVALMARSERRLVVANLGDCRAVLGSSGATAGADNTAVWTARQITRDHNCRLPEEQEALLRAHPTESIGDGGNLVVCKSPHACYVKGRLQLTRALGDLYLKSAEFNAKEGAHRSSGRHIPPPYSPPYVLNTPDVFRIALHDPSRGRDRVLVLASDGVWDYVQPQEAVDLLYAFLHGYFVHLQERAASGSVGAVLLQRDKESIRRLKTLLGGEVDSTVDDDSFSPAAPSVRFPQYEALFRDMYKFADQRNHSDSGSSGNGGGVTAESIAANMLVEVTLRKAAAEAGLPGGVEQLKALPPGTRRRSVHDDTTVVVMYM